MAKTSLTLTSVKYRCTVLANVARRDTLPDQTAADGEAALGDNEALRDGSASGFLVTREIRCNAWRSGRQSVKNAIESADARSLT